MRYAWGAQFLDKLTYSLGEHNSLWAQCYSSDCICHVSLIAQEPRQDLKGKGKVIGGPYRGWNQEANSWCYNYCSQLSCRLNKSVFYVSVCYSWQQVWLLLSKKPHQIQSSINQDRLFLKKLFKNCRMSRRIHLYALHLMNWRKLGGRPSQYFAHTLHCSTYIYLTIGCLQRTE